jgi:hypothetical protein
MVHKVWDGTECRINVNIFKYNRFKINKCDYTNGGTPEVGLKKLTKTCGVKRHRLAVSDGCIIYTIQWKWIQILRPCISIFSQAKLCRLKHEPKYFVPWNCLAVNNEESLIMNINNTKCGIISITWILQKECLYFLLWLTVSSEFHIL